MLETAAQEDIDVIFTFVYAHPEDRDYVEHICGLVEQHGGTVCLVQLRCDAAAQEARVQSPEHERRLKISSVELLREVGERYDLLSPVPDRPGLTIDTTAIPPEEAAGVIVEHFGLSTVVEE